MPKRTSTYVSVATLEAAASASSLSGGINRIADRYREIVRRSAVRERFTEAEFSAILDALNGWLAEPAATIAGGPALEVADALADGLAERYGIDGVGLVAKLRALTFADEVALVDAVERHWHRVCQAR